ncbi:MAG TPA: aminotransferase class I/II-fold pyridoxal phosphate-dependent enzyme, partial [Spirochaetota bacterium]|nr:aminotransferase class I/II-fold pyridoxal phosphate-dependent enzyme [Spirochaetota bacterium]
LPCLEKLVDADPAAVFPYAPSFGRPDIRKKWQEMIYAKNPGLQNSTVSLPIVTHALTHALTLAGYLFINEGDKMIMPDKFWGNYKLIFQNGWGAEFTTFPLFKNSRLNIEGLEQAMQNSVSEKIILMLNFPNNPTGYTPTAAEAEAVKAAVAKSAAAGKKIVVLCDDAYFGLVYEQGIFTESLFSLLADLHENVLAVKIDGATKEDYVWGFRTGFITFAVKNGSAELYQALEAKASGAVRGSISNASNLSQSLLLKTYNNPEYKKEKKEKYSLLKTRYLAVKKVFAENKEYEKFFKPFPFNSGYFMCVQLAEGIEGAKVRQLLLDKYNTGIINIGNILRIAFSAVAAKNVPGLFANIYKACAEV